jgi:tetratricopeptide (TPR) repeat protein
MFNITGDIYMDHGTRKSFRRAPALLRQERELRAWTQSELAERIGTTQINVSRWENGVTVPSPYYRQKLAGLFEKNVQELGFRHETGDIEEAELLESPENHRSPTPLPWNVPYHRNRFFTGREGTLAHLHQVLRNNKVAGLTQPQAINGLGGIGKTQIAVEYAYRYKDYYQAVFWANASTRDTLSAEVVILATLLNLPEQHEHDQDIVVRAVKRWLNTHPFWLLILDNVDNLEVLMDFLPEHGKGDVLLTTRLQALGTVAQTIEIRKMGMEEGSEFLLRRSKIIASGISLDRVVQEKQAQAIEIVVELDGLPLALDQAGAYIEETGCGLTQYLSLYRLRHKELLLRRGRFPTDHPDSVAATWSLSFQEIEWKSPVAADLLRLLAFLKPEAIPEEIITSGAAELGSTLEELMHDPLELDKSVELLLHYSLIRRIPEENALSIHRLVQVVLKDSMDKSMQRVWVEQAIRALSSIFPSMGSQKWESYQRYLPHVQVCLTLVEAYGLMLPEAAHLFHRAASYLRENGRYQEAETLLKQALTIRQHLLKADHPDIASLLNDLGILYFNQGEYPRAKVFLEQALAMRQQVLGEESIEAAQTLYGLANLYRAWGSYLDAEPLYLQALHIRETKLGFEHVATAQSYYGLAKFYYGLEDYHQAKALFERVLSIRTKSLGDSHHKIASALNMLAKIYQKQNKPEEAKKMNLRALEIIKHTSGENHPKAATIINNLIEIYHSEGKYREAEPLIEGALKIHEQSLGLKHPFIAYSLSNLAENCFLQKQYIQAEFNYKQALAIREQNLGDDHLHTAMTYYQLAELYKVMERYEEAELLYRKALVIRKQTFGQDHPAVTRTDEKYRDVLRKLKEGN